MAGRNFRQKDIVSVSPCARQAGEIKLPHGTIAD